MKKRKTLTRLLCAAVSVATAAAIGGVALADETDVAEVEEPSEIVEEQPEADEAEVIADETEAEETEAPEEVSEEDALEAEEIIDDTVTAEDAEIEGEPEAAEETAAEEVPARGRCSRDIICLSRGKAGRKRNNEGSGTVRQ